MRLFIISCLLLVSSQVLLANPLLYLDDVEVLPSAIQLARIKGDTALISDAAANTAASTSSMMDDMKAMRQVMVSRQEILLAINQMSLLQDQGILLVKTAPTQQIADQVADMVNNRDAQPTPIIVPTQSFSQPSSLLSNFQNIEQVGRSAVNGVGSTYRQGNNLFGSIPALLSGGNLWGVVEFVEQAGSTLQGLQGLQGSASSVSSIFYKANSLIYTGRQFLGANWTNPSGIMGMMNMPIINDHNVPSMIIPVAGQLANRLQLVRSGFSSTLPAQSGFQANSSTYQRAQSYAVADGVYMRQESPLDAAYYNMVVKGGGSQATTFAAATTTSKGNGYDPIVGWFDAKDKKDNPNLNDALSGGAYAAVENYNKNNGVSKNSYASFAHDVAPIIPQCIAKTAAGHHLLMSKEDVIAASKMPPVSLGNFKPLLASNSEPSQKYAAILNNVIKIAGLNNEKKMHYCDEASGVIVITPTAREMDNYNASLVASDRRLSDNQRSQNVNAAMLNYVQ